MREKLILAAIEKFGKRGFDAVGTREIAAAVGTPMSSITYHFGGKEGLYDAAAEHILDYLHERVIPPPEELGGESTTDADRIAAITAMLRAVGVFMLSEESAPFALFIGREQQDPSPKVLAMMTVKIRPMMEALAAQVAILRPDLDRAQARAITVYLFGMAITLRHSRASLGILLETHSLTGDIQSMLLDQLDQSVRAILRGPES